MSVENNYPSKKFLTLTEWIIIASTVGASLLITTVITSHLYFRRKRKKSSDNFTLEHIDGKFDSSSDHEIIPPAELGEPEVITSNSSQPKFSYVKAGYNYELSQEEFAIDKTKRLGSGEFGQVYRAKVKRNGQKEEREVAVKMPTEPCTQAGLNGLQDELAYLPYLGKHPYIIELIGVYTAELDRNIVYVFLELCELGSLLEHLKRYEPIEEDMILERETGNAYSALPVIVYSVDENFAMDMYRWSCEIACGMEHIISKGLLHRDLATRNILLTGDRRIKISDFGLTRPMDQSQTYVKKNNNMLPWKWMAPECLPLPGRTQFTEKSEVWSFGVTLWEIYCLGEEPYPGTMFDNQFVSWLEEGNRSPEPRYGRGNIYSVMECCWEGDPGMRPTFTELTRILRDNLTERL